jgi:hypothetical protein
LIQVGATAFAQIAQSLVRQTVQTTGIDIRLELPVPRLGVERRETGPEGRRVLPGKFADRSLDIFDRAHGGKIRRSDRVASGETAAPARPLVAASGVARSSGRNFSDTAAFNQAVVRGTPWTSDKP